VKVILAALYLQILDDFLDASNLSAHQADLDAVRMSRRVGKDIFDDAFGQFAGGLILFQNDQYRHAGFDVRASLAVHDY